MQVANGADVHVILEISAADITPESKESIQVRIKVPENLLNQDSSVIRTFWVVRNHEGVVEFLPTTFDSQTNTLTFETNKFSDYAIVYKDTKKVADETEKPSNTASGTSPQTGDSVRLLPWFVLMLISFGVAAASIVRIRRKRAK